MICDWSQGCTVKTPNPATQKEPGISEPQESLQLWLCSATHHGSPLLQGRAQTHEHSSHLYSWIILSLR